MGKVPKKECAEGAAGPTLVPVAPLELIESGAEEAGTRMTEAGAGQGGKTAAGTPTHKYTHIYKKTHPTHAYSDEMDGCGLVPILPAAPL